VLKAGDAGLPEPAENAPLAERGGPLQPVSEVVTAVPSCEPL